MKEEDIAVEGLNKETTREKTLSMFNNLRKNPNNVTISPLYRQWMNLQRGTTMGRLSQSKVTTVP